MKNSTTKNATETQFTNPDVAMDVVARLYYGSKRASALVKETVEATEVSEPTVYSVLTELQKLGVVRKDVRSKRNVTYQLTDSGRGLLEREKFALLDQLLAVAPGGRRREILLGLLLEDMLHDMPEDWLTQDRQQVLRQATNDEIEDVKRRLLRLAGALR